MTVVQATVNENVSNVAVYDGQNRPIRIALCERGAGLRQSNGSNYYRNNPCNNKQHLVGSIRCLHLSKNG